MTTFASPLELAQYTNGTTDLADLCGEWIAQAHILLELISADVEAAAGAPIEGYSSTVLLPGTWSRDLELPAGQISAVSAVTLNGVALDPSGYWWNGRSTLRRGVNAFDVLDDDADDTPAIHDQGATSRAGRGWGGPTATVAVELDGGFTEVPDFVRSLVLRVAARTIGNVQGVTQETLAVYSVTYGASSGDSGSHVTAAERRILRKIMRRTGGTIVAAGL